jgi:transposase
VLAPGLGRTKTGWVWTYVLDDRPFGGTTPPAAFYRYTPDRKGEHPREHLRDFRGILQADGYAGFARLYGNGVIEAACLAHARRKCSHDHLSSKKGMRRSRHDCRCAKEYSSGKSGQSTEYNRRSLILSFGD